MQGWRLEMEDAHIATDMPSQPDHTFVAVFDGLVMLLINDLFFLFETDCILFLTFSNENDME